MSSPAAPVNIIYAAKHRVFAGVVKDGRDADIFLGITVVGVGGVLNGVTGVLVREGGRGVVNTDGEEEAERH